MLANLYHTRIGSKEAGELNVRGSLSGGEASSNELRLEINEVPNLPRNYEKTVKVRYFGGRAEQGTSQEIENALKESSIDVDNLPISNALLKRRRDQFLQTLFENERNVLLPPFLHFSRVSHIGVEELQSNYFCVLSKLKFLCKES